MSDDKLLQELTISPIIEKIQIGDKTKPKYYKIGKQLPKYLQDENLYYWSTNPITKETIRCDRKTRHPVIKNKKKVGQPSFWTVNGQDIFNGYKERQERAFIVNKLKKELRPFVVSQLKQFKDEDYPLRIELHYHSQKPRIDIDNKGWIFFKCLQDLLVDKRMKGKTEYFFKEPYIKDDSVDYICDTGRIKFHLSEENKMVFKFYKTSY